MDNITFTLILTGFTILLGIIGFLIKDKINTLEKHMLKSDEKIETMEKEIKEMKTNYISRFDNIKEHISNELKPIYDTINEMGKSLVEVTTKLKIIIKEK